MNIMATIAGFTIPGTILFIVVFLVGHVFNLVINVLGGAARAAFAVRGVFLALL